MFGMPGLGIGMSVYLRDHFSANAQRINGQMLQMYGNAQALKKGLNDNFEGLALMGGAVFGASLLAARGITNMVKTGMEFHKIMDAVAAVSGATGAELDNLKNKAITLGKTTIFSMRDVGHAMEDLAKAGFTAGQIADSIEGVTHLAAASDYGLLQSADILNNVMQIFGKSAKDSEHVADLLTYAVNKSNINMEDMFEALKYFGDVATDLNIPLEDSLALIMKLGNAGIKGSIAGTSLGNWLRYLTKAATPFATSKQIEGLAMMGLSSDSFKTPNGNLKTVTEMVDILLKASQTLTSIEKQAAFEAIFGVRGKRGVTPLMRMSEIGGSLEEYSQSLKSSEVFGTAKQVSEQKLDNLAGDVKKLNAAWEALSVTFTEKLEPFFRGIVQSVTWIVNGIQRIIDSPLGGVLAAATVALTAFGLAWGGIRLAVGLFGRFFLTASTSFKSMGASLSLTLNSVLAQLFGINQGLRGVALNSAGRPYVKAGHTVTHNGKTYGPGRILPMGYFGKGAKPGQFSAGKTMGKGVGRGIGGMFGMMGIPTGAATSTGSFGGPLTGIFNMIRGGFGKLFSGLFSMVGGWWGVGLGLIGAMLLSGKSPINAFGDALSAVTGSVISFGDRLGNGLRNVFDYFDDTLEYGEMSSSQQRVADRGVIDYNQYLADLYGGESKPVTMGDYYKGGNPRKQNLNNYIYIDGKLQTLQTIDTETEEDIETYIGQ